MDVINVIKNAVTGSLFVSNHHQNPVRLVVLETAITVIIGTFPSKQVDYRILAAEEGFGKLNKNKCMELK